ncbi:ABC transporter substrate-binding protein [Burkholderia sp. Bp8963]|uniref:extracellular solute-binding protein n=1 Tax=Burkholderia sp. Bp8963 TaxID=2184547 RepID=UPI000F5A9702|nr:extracellular solute-binding protein [Burkholderia sp. Bp8963]RQS61557.1 ABC transporter substrate-binding protein [Burkholderia sp. Bp8963]
MADSARPTSRARPSALIALIARVAQVARVARCVCIAGAVTLAHASPDPQWQTTLALFDDARPDASMQRFAWADRAPPRDGTLRLANYTEIATYDSLNPFLLRGNAAPDEVNLMFETLMQRSLDEVGTQYPLLADRVEIAPGGLSATFHLNPAARFSNGKPVTAQDVRYSFEQLTGSTASPLYSSRYALIRAVDVIDAQTVRFSFRAAQRRAVLEAGDLYVFSRDWARAADGSALTFDQLATVEPIASGPYLIGAGASNHEIVYRRNPRYWGADLPVRRGMFNFANVSFRLYSDPSAPLQAFRAGDVDAISEGSAEQWTRNYSGPAFANGTLRKQEFPDHGISNAQGLFFNLRRPKFQDIRVREAIGLAVDYEWINRNMFFGQYTRTRSFFDESVFAARGAPGADELALLEPLRGGVPPEVFGALPPQPDTSAHNGLRRNLARAEALLASAGWHYRDGVLRNAAGTPFTIELFDDGTGMERILMIVVRNLKLLGIDARLRIMDQTVIVERLKHFDFDMTTLGYRAATIPGAELERRFGSRAARTPGSENYTGIASPAVDALVDNVQRAGSEREVIAAARALDRVLLCERIIVPEWHATHSRIAWNRRIAPPARVPRQYGELDWVIGWWHAAPDARNTNAATRAAQPE